METTETSAAKPAPVAPVVAKKRRGHPSLSHKNKIGLVMAFVVGLANLPSVLGPSGDEGHDGPPMAVNVLDTVCGAIILAAVVIAWRRGLRGAIRLQAGANILAAISAFPAFFVDVPAGLKVAAAVFVVITFVSVVLSLSPGASSGEPR